MYYADEPEPWYKNYGVLCILAIIIVLLYGYATGQVKPECLRQDCPSGWEQ